jgi:hypothetical protein
VLGHFAPWKSAFNGVRDEKALAALPETERLAWRQLWADVEPLRAEAGGK